MRMRRAVNDGAEGGSRGLSIALRRADTLAGSSFRAIVFEAHVHVALHFFDTVEEQTSNGWVCCIVTAVSNAITVPRRDVCTTLRRVGCIGHYINNVVIAQGYHSGGGQHCPSQTTNGTLGK
jgi:hypothetical protein